MGKKIYGLLGEHLGHSFSPAIHKALGNADYELYELQEEELESFLKQDDIGGLNVTIPYKQKVLPFVEQLSPAVEAIGATNTLFWKDGKLTAENTDVLGFMYLAEHAGISMDGKKVAVLGNGGAAQAIKEAVRRMGASEMVVFDIVPGEGVLPYEELPNHYDAEIVVNSTPVGMYPGNLKAVTKLAPFENLSGVLDIVYNPLLTGLTLEAEELGIPHANGLGMLVAQAVRSHEFFFGTTVNDSVIEDITASLKQDASNIILIGMPGSGKTSVSKLLAEKTGRDVIDLDAEIELTAGKSIPEIFAEEGEEVFRDIETQCIKKAGALSGEILSLGGGAVTKERNYLPLHQNGRIYCLKRDLSLLVTNGRPLSKDLETLKRMEVVRAPMYERFTDVVIVNDKTLEDAANAILEDFHQNVK